MQGVTANNALLVGRSGPFSGDIHADLAGGIQHFVPPRGGGQRTGAGQCNGQRRRRLHVQHQRQRLGLVHRRVKCRLRRQWPRFAPSPTWNNVSSGDPASLLFRPCRNPNRRTHQQYFFHATTDTGGNAGISRHRRCVATASISSLGPAARATFGALPAAIRIGARRQGHSGNFTNVIFDNTGSNSTISIAQSVQPSNIAFNNSTVPYSFSGSAISGTGSVLMSGAAGSVTFNNANTYTGTTTIIGGTLTLSQSAGRAKQHRRAGPLLLDWLSHWAIRPQPSAVSPAGGTLSLQELRGKSCRLVRWQQ